MKLTEYKGKSIHFFKDEQRRRQGKYKSWYPNGHQWTRCHYRDGELHGEYKWWNSAGELLEHTFYIDAERIIDFKKNPELYPTTPEEKTMFVLKYGNAPFIGDSSEIT